MRVGSVVDSFDEIFIVINFRSDRFDNKTSSAQHILLLNGRGYKSLKLSAKLSNIIILLRKKKRLSLTNTLAYWANAHINRLKRFKTSKLPAILSFKWVGGGLNGQMIT
jgi:hypothetical protein